MIAYRVELRQGEKVGHFISDSKLGSGTFGSVYKVWNERNNEYVALKLLRLYDIAEGKEELKQRFQREYEIGKMRLPNTVHTYETGEIKGNPYFTLMYCEKGSLDRYSGTVLPKNLIKGYFVDILKGLKGLHEHPETIIHRDLKPGNILIGPESLLLSDMGSAGVVNNRMTKRDLFGRAKEVFGTYAYISPEQLDLSRAFKSLSGASDIFSLGVILYEWLTGKLPFGPLTEYDEMPAYTANAKKGRILDAGSIPAEWEKIVKKCLSPDPKDRPSAQALLEEIEGRKRFEPDSRPDGGAHLQIIEGENLSKYNLQEILRKFHHPNQKEGYFHIGRNTKDPSFFNHISIQETSSTFISRRHATLIFEMTSGNWYLRDGQVDYSTGRWGQSVNGTFVNGKELDKGETVRLKSNDVIKIGKQKIVFRQ